MEMEKHAQTIQHCYKISACALRHSLSNEQKEEEEEDGKNEEKKTKIYNNTRTAHSKNVMLIG